MVASRPFRDGGVALVTETKPMAATIRKAIDDCPAVAQKVNVRAPKGRVPHIIVYSVPIGSDTLADPAHPKGLGPKGIGGERGPQARRRNSVPRPHGQDLLFQLS
ncbi:hypothetical protein AVEN_62851-1 [Araneus ventricosus]|uniref:Uncharacterized protein n=1 Tax=Araneus ventricosus TaxID=182803 RepID=A0A4Y2QUE6_ARAVE|nr:hypothetical protein AVEN_62851-1 [Araneus ventricosus]